MIPVFASGGGQFVQRSFKGRTDFAALLSLVGGGTATIKPFFGYSYSRPTLLQTVGAFARMILPVLVIAALVAVAFVLRPHFASSDPVLSMAGAAVMGRTVELAEGSRTPVRTPPVLQGVAREFKGQQLVADEVAPVRPVDDEMGKYQIFGKDDLYEVDNTYRAGAIPNAITSRESEDTFNTELRVIRHPLLDESTDPKRPGGSTRERRVTTKVTLATQIAREGRVARLFTTAANYPAGHVLAKAGAAEWDAAGVVNTVQPITDIESRIQKVTDATLTPRGGVDVVIPAPVFDKTSRFYTAIREYYKYTQKGVTTPELLAELMGVRRILIATGMFAGNGVENAANDISTGIATSNLWGDNVWVGIVDSQDLDLLTFARQFAYRRETGGQDIQIRQYRMADEGQRGDWIEAAEQRDLKLTANFAGALITNCLA
jgi:hypothetical protein